MPIMTVDSFKFLPRAIATFYQLTDVQPAVSIPWTNLRRPLSQCRLAVLSSGGLYLADRQRPFDVARERSEPEWGDPGVRFLPAHETLADLAVSHLHYAPDAVLADLNVLLPLGHLCALASEGVLAALAPTAYSVMGYQGYPPSLDGWATHAAPSIARQLGEEKVDALILVPT